MSMMQIDFQCNSYVTCVPINTSMIMYIFHTGHSSRGERQKSTMLSSA